MLAVVFLAAVLAAAQADNINILIIMMDDLGHNDVGWNSPNIISPNLDALAEGGVIIGTSYTQAVCTPSRGALLTGMFAFHLGMQHNVLYTDTKECAPQSQQFMSEAFKDMGYATHLVGKWHLGYCDVKCTPTYRGFDTFYGFYNGYIDHYFHTVSHGYDWRDGLEPDASNNGTYATWLMRDRAIEIISDHDASQPFFMLVTLPTTHTPIQVPQEYQDMYPDVTDPTRRKIQAMVTASDDAIHEVVSAFQDAGLYDNGVVIFTADNGGQMGFGSNDPYRGCKGSVWEGGTRVSTFINSPLIQKTGYTNYGLFHEVDWFPTLMSMAGGSTSGLDGVDQSDMILNGGESARDTIPIQIDTITIDPPVFGQGAIRKGDWKFIRGYPGIYDGWDSDAEGVYMIHEKMFAESKRDVPVQLTRRGEYVFDFDKINKTVQAYEGKKFLYNLADDPAEKNDVAADNPDVVDELEALLDAYLPSVYNPPLPTRSEDANPDNYDGFWSSGWCTVER